MNENPYAAPQSPLSSTEDDGDWEPATVVRRFFGWAIDSIAVQILIVVYVASVVALRISLGEPMADVMSDYNSDSQLMNLLRFSVGAFTYYFILEGLFQRTLGKLLLGMKTISTVGDRLTFGQTLGRSLARLIPFDGFSFLSSDGGWHDTLSHTTVVRRQPIT